MDMVLVLQQQLDAIKVKQEVFSGRGIVKIHELEIHSQIL